jgi:hypothetical protein
MRTQWVVVLALLAGLTFGYEMEARHLDVVHAAPPGIENGSENRFEIFYSQQMNGKYDNFTVYAIYDKHTSQESICTKLIYDNSAPSCYLTGRILK